MKDLLKIKYERNTAGESQVRSHLEKCDSNFVPRLSEKVDIAQYAKKIIINAVTFEAWQDDEITGLIAAYFNDTKNKNGYITNVSILKQYEGQGIGSQLMKMCIEYAKEINYNNILLEVYKGNNNAINLYTKYGFLKAQSTKNLLQMKLNL